jgi:hypothetical protein
VRWFDSSIEEGAVPHSRLKILDAPGCCGLREIQPGSGAVNGAGFSNSHEGFNVLQIHEENA